MFFRRYFPGNPRTVATPIPATPSLAVVDDADGTGATATISGSAVGSTNAVYAQNVITGGAFVLAGSRAGNGTIDLTLPQGTYFAHARSSVPGASSLSGVVRFSVTAGLSSPHWLCVQGVRDRIIDLNLPEIGSTVYARPLPDSEATLELPCAIVTPIDVDEYGRNSTCDYKSTYPVTVLLCDRKDPDDADELEKWLYWRWRVSHDFMSDTRVADVVQRGSILPSTVLAEKLRDYQYVRSHVVFSFDVYQARG